MNAVVDTPDVLPHKARHSDGVRLRFTGVLRSEWIKLVTLRSTIWCYVIVLLLTVGLAALIAQVIPTEASDAPTGPGPGGGFDTTAGPEAQWLTISTAAVGFAQLVIVVLGALVITGEYGTGMIRSTFSAVPKRLPAIAAKAIVFAVVTFVVGAVALGAAALVSRPILVARGLEPDFGDPGVWLGLLGAAAYLTLLGLLALAIGTIVRSTAAGIATAVGLVLVAPTVLTLVGALTQADWASNLSAVLPSAAGARLYSYQPEGSVVDGVLTLDAAQGLLVLVAWVVVASVAAGILVKRRDA
jgi:ABC-2 type transport system permease protein